jgi:Peptidase A4 family
MKNRMFNETIQRFQQTIKNANGSKIAFGMTLALFMLNGLASAQSGPTLTTATISPRQHAPMKLHGRVPGGVETDNWSGYAVTGSAFTDAKGSWHVPEVNCSKSPNSYSAFWVGIDGYNNGTVEQNGTESDCSGTTPVYYAWYEFFPAPPVVISDVPVSPGDVISAEVSYNGSEFILYIKNETTGKSHSRTKAIPGAQRVSAEWIAEAPGTSEGILPLADFGKANFGEDKTGISGTNYATDSSTSGQISDFGSNVQEITMVSSKNVVEAVPTSLTKDGTSFTVAWKAE